MSTQRLKTAFMSVPSLNQQNLITNKTFAIKVKLKTWPPKSYQFSFTHNPLAFNGNNRHRAFSASKNILWNFCIFVVSILRQTSF